MNLRSVFRSITRLSGRTCAFLLVLLTFDGPASAQSVQTIPCPVPSVAHQCIASNEVCGWRNQRATAAELEDAKRGGLSISAPCPTLPNGVAMESCWIDRITYCKAPSPADIARAEQVRKERETKAMQEKLASENRAREVAIETARLGGHRETEARRLVELRERAKAARTSNGIASGHHLQNQPIAEKSETAPACTPRLKQGREGFGIGFRYTRQRAEEVLRENMNRVCDRTGYRVSSELKCSLSLIHI